MPFCFPWVQMLVWVAHWFEHQVFEILYNHHLLQLISCCNIHLKYHWCKPSNRTGWEMYYNIYILNIFDHFNCCVNVVCDPHVKPFLHVLSSILYLLFLLLFITQWPSGRDYFWQYLVQHIFGHFNCCVNVVCDPHVKPWRSTMV